MLADPAEAGEMNSTVTELAEAGEIKLTLADPADRMLVIQLQPAKFRRWWIQLKQANEVALADPAALLHLSRVTGLSSELGSSTCTNHH